MRRALVTAALLALASAGCSAASPDRGLDAQLQVVGAQFVPGRLPGAGGGPTVRQISLADTTVAAGEHDRPLLGQLDPAATAVALGLEGDRGYWIVLAGEPRADEPTLPTFDVLLGFARGLAPGTHTLVAQAADVHGHYGAAAAQTFTVTPAALPSGPLVVHLEWSGDADLDLHVVDPAGVEIWAGHPSGYQPPPPPQLPDPNGPAQAARLDADSNPDCVIDGRDQENVVWSLPPPSGPYIVRVDAPSLCGAPLADWRVEVSVDGSVRARATGEALDSDSRGSHRAGAGRTALTFDLP